MEKEDTAIYVLDSSVFIEQKSRQFLGKTIVTCYEVIDEMKSLKASIEADYLQKQGLEVLEPQDEFFDKVQALRKTTNDKVSKTDMKVVALALQFHQKGKKVVLVSDDYAVQNLAKILKIEINSPTQKGAKDAFAWYKKCKSCGSKVPQEENECPVCGSEAKFVPRRM